MRPLVETPQRSSVRVFTGKAPIGTRYRRGTTAFTYFIMPHRSRAPKKSSSSTLHGTTEHILADPPKYSPRPYSCRVGAQAIRRFHKPEQHPTRSRSSQKDSSSATGTARPCLHFSLGWHSLLCGATLPNGAFVPASIAFWAVVLILSAFSILVYLYVQQYFHSGVYTSKY